MKLNSYRLCEQLQVRLRWTGYLGTRNQADEFSVGYAFINFEDVSGTEIPICVWGKANFDLAVVHHRCEEIVENFPLAQLLISPTVCQCQSGASLVCLHTGVRRQRLIG